MRQIFIECQERSGILALSLLSGSPEALCTVEVPLDEVHLVLEKFGAIFEGESLHCQEEMDEIGELFAKVLGLEFGKKLISFATSEPTSFTVKGDSDTVLRLPWEMLGSPTPIGLQPNVRFTRAFASDKRPKSVSSDAVSLHLFTSGMSDSSAMLHYAAQEVSTVAKLFDNHSHFQVQCHHDVDTSQFEGVFQAGPVDIFHYAGHGVRRQTGGALSFKNTTLYGEEIFPLLDQANVRLAVLTGCWTAGYATAIGHQLCKMGTPHVVAMQGPISDSGADLFARNFYSSLSQGRSVEDSMHDGRQSLKGSGRDWLMPLLYRSGDFEPMILTPSQREVIKHNFPEASERFVGRGRELARLNSILARQDCRLLTITGMGGMGKTTIAHEVGRAQWRSMKHGARLVECEALHSEADLLAAVVDSLEVDLFVGKPKDLIQYLRDLEILLVFDCFERIVKEAPFLSTLLRECPQLKILVTSRILLGLNEEHEFPLEPLSTKKRKGSLSEAVELFVVRARLVLGEKQFTKKDLSLIANLVEDLECIPLAIVLAAGRLRYLALAELQTRVRENRLEVVRRTGKARELRQGDMLRVVRDSLNLLEKSEQELLSILSVFARGFFTDDAERVIAGTASMDSVGTLRDNSLLSTEIVNEKMRYRMLDTVRECLDVTPMGVDLQPFRLRHAELFAHRAKELRSYSVEQVGTVFRIEGANFRQAILTSIKNESKSLMRTFVDTLARTLTEMGHKEEFNLLVGFSESFLQDDANIMIQLRGYQGVLARRDGNPTSAMRFWQDRAEFCRQTPDEAERLADTLLDLTDLALEQKKSDRVRELLDEFESISKDSLSKEILASGLVLHAHFHLSTKDYERSLAYAKQAEELLSKEEATQGHLYNQMRVAQIYRWCGNLEKGLSLVKQTVQEAISSSHYHSAGISLIELEDIFLEKQQYELAAKALVAGGRIPRDVSVSLREKFRKKALEFRELGHEDVLFRVDKGLLKVDWKDIALEVSEGDSIFS
jgi:predicted ATPase/tetratricopeptide (TPR) repeat protein